MAYGSFINMIAHNSGTSEPEVGMGATYLGWSDRHPYTIAEVVRFKSGAKKGEIKGVYARQDQSKRTDQNGMSEVQSWEFIQDPSAPLEYFPKRKDGRFSKGPNYGTLSIGVRDRYHDFSF